MNRGRPTISHALALMALFSVWSPLAAQESRDASKQSKLVALVPLGVPIHQFHMPQYNRLGQIVSRIEVDQLKRVSDRQFTLDDVCIRLFAHGIEFDCVSVPTVEALPSSGRSLMVAGLVGGALHLRVFDSAGNRTLDLTEDALPQGPQLEQLKRECVNYASATASADATTPERTSEDLIDHDR